LILFHPRILGKERYKIFHNTYPCNIFIIHPIIEKIKLRSKL